MFQYFVTMIHKEPTTITLVIFSITLFFQKFFWILKFGQK